MRAYALTWLKENTLLETILATSKKRLYSQFTQNFIPAILIAYTSFIMERLLPEQFGEKGFMNVLLPIQFISGMAVKVCSPWPARLSIQAKRPECPRVEDLMIYFHAEEVLSLSILVQMKRALRIV